VVQGFTSIVHKAEAPPPREMKTEGGGVSKDSASASTSSASPQAERMGTVCAFLDVIAFMDVPVDSPELAALLAAPPQLQRDARQSGSMLTTGARREATSEEQGAAIPFPARVRSTRARGDKRAHPSTFDAAVSKKLHAGGARRGRRTQPEHEVSDSAIAALYHPAALRRALDHDTRRRSGSPVSDSRRPMQPCDMAASAAMLISATQSPDTAPPFSEPPSPAGDAVVSDPSGVLGYLAYEKPMLGEIKMPMLGEIKT